MPLTKPRLNVGSAALRSTVTPETVVLWALVAAELGFHVLARRYFRRQHGG